jgi:hypothetical protein
VFVERLSVSVASLRVYPVHMDLLRVEDSDERFKALLALLGHCTQGNPSCQTRSEAIELFPDNPADDQRNKAVQRVGACTCVEVSGGVHHDEGKS